MKLGTCPTLHARDFWKSLNLAVEWVEGPCEELLKQNLDGIFVNSDLSDEVLNLFKEVPRSVLECGFVDFIEIENKKSVPRSFLRSSGAEFLARGHRFLDTRMRAYITGVGPWSRLFTMLAVERGYKDIHIVVEEPEQADMIIEGLKRFCFGVEISALRHSDLTLQPNNGSFLVNTMTAEQAPDVISDLAYLNYLSPDGLVVETPESDKENPLIEEARNSKLSVLDGETTRAFAEFQAFRHFRKLLPMSFEEYLAQRKSFFKK